MRTLIILTAIYLTALSGLAQEVVPTKGKEFWVGFMQNFIDDMPGESLELFLTSDVSTSGTVSIPGQGWSEAFTISTNASTTVSLPVGYAECRENQEIQNRGIYVESADTISVFAINFEPYTADATKVLPIQSLGTSYRVTSYAANGTAGSELLVVATEDDTEIAITPTAETKEGNLPGIPMIVSLNAGQTYLVQSVFPGDLTGSTIEATEQSGDCRPFAVFAGATCASVPETCNACDHIFEQHFPTSTWGTSFVSVPFLGPDTYTLKILADQDNTNLTLEGATYTLMAGDALEQNGLTSPVCISSDFPIQVAQMMEGVECSGVGDPAMVILNSEDQQIDHITFATVISDVIDQHSLTVITETSNVCCVDLNGSSIPASDFVAFPDCPDRSYAQISISEGSHTLQSEGMFTAYVYGNGFAESYAYSAGSFSRTEVEEPEVFCASDDLTLEASPGFASVDWVFEDDLDTVLSSGDAFTLTAPFESGIYEAHGTDGVSGCLVTESFDVEYSAPPTVLFSEDDPSICVHDSVFVEVTITGFTADMDAVWNTTEGVSDSTSTATWFNPITTSEFALHLTSPGGCINQTVPYIVQVIEEDPSFELGEDHTLCEGEALELQVDMPAGFTHDWSTDENTSSISFSDAGWLSLEVESPGGCSHADSLFVTVNALPDPAWDLTPAFCEGDSALFILTDPDWDVNWSDGESGDRWIDNDDVHGFVVSSAEGCDFSEAVEAEVWDTPDLYLPDEVYFCEGDDAPVEAIAEDVDFLWDDGSNEPTALADGPGYFGVVITDAHGCLNSDSTLVEIIPRPTADLGDDVVLCEGETLVLNVGPTDHQVYWNTGENGPSIIVDESNVYEVTLSNGICADSDEVLVSFVPLPNQPFPADSSWCFIDGPLVLDALNIGGTFTWSDGSDEAQIEVYEAGEITVSITSSLGCSRDFGMEVLEFCPDATLYVPEAFTPDNDGINDSFQVQGHNIADFHIEIWNRWGEKVWSAESMDESWDGLGEKQNSELESEVYVYHIVYTTIQGIDVRDSVPVEVRGFLTLLR